MEKNIKRAIEVLNKGGIIIFPTDTAFGIGCRIDNEKAVGRLFKIRKRPKDQPPPVLVDSLGMARNYAEIPKDVENELIKNYWPGGLTIILQSRINKVPCLIKGKGATLGVRMPDHPTTVSLIRGVGVPILGPSANFHGERTPYEFSDLDPELMRLVDYVVFGKCVVKKQSTVIDCSKRPWRILREGAVKIQNLEFKIKNYNVGIKTPIVLTIDTSDNKEIKVGLRIDHKEDVRKQKIGLGKAQVVLPMIENLLKKYDLKLGDLTAIEVNTGPGSFTGIRVGLSVANALVFALGKKVSLK